MNVNPIKININGVTHEVHVSSINDHSIQLCIDGNFFELQITPSIHNSNHSDDLYHSRDNSKNQPILSFYGSNLNIDAQMPGKVIAVCVQPGELVSVGQLLCTIEAMKMEQNIVSPIDGVIDTIHVKPMESVLSGHTLMTFKQS